MNDKFKAIPVEEDTRILQKQLMTVNGIDARFERWSWEGVVAESLIFVTEEITDQSDEQLWQSIIKQLSVSAAMHHTISRKESYTFVNFNFEV
jgi:hypothetical protein